MNRVSSQQTSLNLNKKLISCLIVVDCWSLQNPEVLWEFIRDSYKIYMYMYIGQLCRDLEQVPPWAETWRQFGGTEQMFRRTNFRITFLGKKLYFNTENF